MKQWSMVLMMVCLSIASEAQTWDEWFNQKKTQKKYLLAQIALLQTYLGYLEKGYQIAEKGLTLIGDIKRGDFKLHHDFFTSLQHVNPAIKQSAKVVAIITMQADMLADYKNYYKCCQTVGVFSTEEVKYIYAVFSSLIGELAADIEGLTTVITDGKLEMKDNERIDRIDKLYNQVQDKYAFLHSFGNEISLQAAQRQRALRSTQELMKMY